mmetsp:Transcript_31317/g.42405  ORF Transcript_31317/g.42405 Transcript_31317/m.42405 type:complete len:203 (+) Transcript_31317:786-1394(+)
MIGVHLLHKLATVLQRKAPLPPPWNQFYLSPVDGVRGETPVPVQLLEDCLRHVRVLRGRRQVLEVIHQKLIDVLQIQDGDAVLEQLLIHEARQVEREGGLRPHRDAHEFPHEAVHLEVQGVAAGGVRDILVHGVDAAHAGDEALLFRLAVWAGHEEGHVGHVQFLHHVRQRLAVRPPRINRALADKRDLPNSVFPPQLPRWQ